MSIKVMTWVWDESRSTGTARLVLLAIADNAEDDGTQAWPSLDTLAKKCSVSRSTIRRAIAGLVDLGELRVREGEGGPASCRPDRRPNAYDVLMLRGVNLHPRGSNGVSNGTERGVKSNGNGVSLLEQEQLLNRPYPSASPAGFFDTHPDILRDLQAKGIPEVLLDDAFCAGIDKHTTGTDVYWDTELVRYVLWWEAQPRNSRHTNLRSGFSRWISRCVRDEREVARAGR